MSEMNPVQNGSGAAAARSVVLPLELTLEELALLRASVTFHARWVSDPHLRDRLESAAAKLNRLDPSGMAAGEQQAA